MPAEILEFEEGFNKRNIDLEREKILKLLNVPNVIGVYANLSPEWRADKELALAVMSRDGLALQYASAELQNNLEVVEAAVTNTKLAWPLASREMQNQRQEIMARVEKNLKDNRNEAIAGLKRETKKKGEPNIYEKPNPELEKILKIIKENWWKSSKFENRVRDVADALGMDPAIVKECMIEAITPECLVRISAGAEKGIDQQPLVEALNKIGMEIYCLLEVLKKMGYEIFGWTLGDKEWQKEKFSRSGASNFIDPDHLYVAEGEKNSQLRKILDRIISEKNTKPISVYVVDDNPEQLREAMALSEEYGQKGIELHNYNLKLNDPQADGTAFYKWITQEHKTHPDLILVLDFDQVIADTDGALFGPACKNILRRRSEQESIHPQAA